jgi:hypothetical protein
VSDAQTGARNAYMEVLEVREIVCAQRANSQGHGGWIGTLLISSCRNSACDQSM